MSMEIRGAAKASFKDGEVQYWLPAPDVPRRPDEADIFATVFQQCLQGDIEAIEPVEVQVRQVVAPGEPNDKRYLLLGEVAASSSLKQSIE